MRLNTLKPNPGSRHRKKRLGSGESSGKGKTCGKGHKGQKSRSGASIRPGFEGGQMPLARQLPKRGFNNKQFKTNYIVVNVGQLEERFEEGSVVNETALRDAGIVSRRCDGIKILGSGDLKKKLTVEVDKISASAREKIEKAGGTCSIVEKREGPARGSAKAVRDAKVATIEAAKAETPVEAPKAEAPAKAPKAEEPAEAPKAEEPAEPEVEADESSEDSES
jgi:large subunit ribosomal protein L15